MSAYRGPYGVRCHVCGDIVEYLALESWTVLPRDEESGRAAGICTPCWESPPAMRVFEAVAEGSLTPAQGAALLVRNREPTWWERFATFCVLVAEAMMGRWP